MSSRPKRRHADALQILPLAFFHLATGGFAAVGAAETVGKKHSGRDSQSVTAEEPARRAMPGTALRGQRTAAAERALAHGRA